MFVLLACGGTDETSEDNLVSSAPRPFNVEDARGSATTRFATPTGTTEVCVIPKHFTEDGFTDSDRKKEKKLCTVDFNAAAGTPNVLPAGLAPKNNSTNPAVDIYLVDATHSRESIESTAQVNAAERSADKYGRFKQSLGPKFERTGTYAPSMIGYYHTSRLLGKIAEVGPNVLRTMDVKRHLKVAQQGAALPLSQSRIVKTMWSLFVTADQAATKDPLTFTTDGKQLYGAYLAKVSGDVKAYDIDTTATLTASKQFKNLTNASGISAFTGPSFKEAVQTIVPMQGIAEMLVLDSIMLQADRLSGSNVSYIPYVYFKNADGTVGKDQKDDLTADALAALTEPTEVKKIYLNDVDAGLNFNNAEGFQKGTEYGLLKRIAHISPDLYVRVLKLRDLVNTPAFEAFVKSEWLYTDRDFYRYKAQSIAVATLLHDRCAAKQLVLDLDIGKHIAGTNKKAGEGCEGN